MYLSYAERCYGLMGALCEGRAIQRQSIWCAGLSCLSRSLNQTNKRDQINRMNQFPATRCKVVPEIFFSSMPLCSTLNATASVMRIF